MQRWTHSLGRAVLSLALLMAGVTAVQAQGVTTAAIQGTVSTEGTGVAVEGAQIELKSLQTGQSFRTTTRSNGRYSFENVTPGPGYQLTTRAIGFLPQVQQGLTLGLGTRQVRDAIREKVAAWCAMN